MKLNTHDHTPKTENNKTITLLFVISIILMYGIFCLASFVCFYYAQNVIGGIAMLIIPIFLIALVKISIRDFEKAYVEIGETDIRVVDSRFGIKKERLVQISDITNAEICPGSSFKVKGIRVNRMQYIVFRKGKEYLFKIIYLPETAEAFNDYLS